jgi:hypothetical protein
LFLCGALVAISATAQDTAVIGGFVTRAASPSDFDINGQKVFCASITRIVEPEHPNASYLGCPNGPVYLGQGVAVTGEWDKKSHIIRAAQIEFTPGPPHDVSSSAMIDAPPESGDPAAGALLLRADGYRIHLDAKTQITWTEPLHSLADVKAGGWIDYQGTRNPDGSVTATRATLMPAFDSPTGGNVDTKRFPPYTDPAMQARIDAIGAKLLPAWERDLPDASSIKFHFHFTVVESNTWWDINALPSGTILVPHEIVERMQNDSQLAAILADGIASVFERQQFRAGTPGHVAAAASMASDAAGHLTGRAGKGAVSPAEEQSGRVAIGLLHDAGYDIDQAPVAWWLLADKKPAPILDTPLPHRAAYIYQTLGENWHNPAIVVPNP